jgi:hypothetical protein
VSLFNEAMSLFVQARELCEMFDQLIQMGQNRRIGMLREISMRRA